MSRMALHEITDGSLTPAETSLLDTSHPGFKRALFVLCDQLWERSFSHLIDVIFLPPVIWLAQHSIGLILPRPYVEIVVYSASVYLQWRSHNDDSLWYSFPTHFDYVNHVRISPYVRRGLMFAIPLVVWGTGAILIHSRPQIFWYPWSLIWRIVTNPASLLLGTVTLVVSLSPKGRRLITQLLQPVRACGDRAQVLLATGSYHPFSWHRPWVRQADKCVTRVSSMLRARRERLARGFLQSGVLDPQTHLYTKLPDKPDEPRQIRLLKLSSGIWTARCDLVVVSIDPARRPKFEAISWRWGDPQKTHSLHLGSSVRHITTRVSDILCELTPNYGDRYIWLDYICIDQDREDDQNNQIPLMTDIYRGASRVVACLGDGEGSQLVPDFLADLEAHIIERFLVRLFPSFDRTNHFPFADRQAEWRALLSLLANEFWSRAWIIQEIVVAQSVVLVYGGQTIPWSIFAGTIKYFKVVDRDGIAVLTLRETFGVNKRACRHGIDFVGRLEYLREQYAIKKLMILPELLVECIQSGATLPHDKVYALLNLDLEESYKKDISLGYKSPVIQKYQEITGYSLKKGSFVLIGLAGIANRLEQSEVPSWVPDLSKLPCLYPFDNASCKYTAGGKQQSNVAYTSGSSIQLSGILLDEIYLIDRTCPWKSGYNASDNEIEAYAQQVLAGEKLKERVRWPLSFLPSVRNHIESLGRHHYFDGTPIEDALMRTAIGDDDNITFPAGDKISVAFAMLKTFYEMMLSGDDNGDIPNGLRSLSEREILSNAQWLCELMGRRAMGRQIAITKLGYLLLVPDAAAEGDTVVLVQGARVPYVLRRHEDAFILVGEAYAHSFMNGKYVDSVDVENRSRITLL